ncbi:MAG: A/G-specific adenine glycosylase [Syntrophobacteraceae bacterium]|nr:A/G-specific adenine glycosylase [Syntrophobacteraceae bacterium]
MEGMDPLQDNRKKTYAKIRQHLLRWFRKNRRDLPWRETYAPYQVWISEVMLQQTRVFTVLPYYQRWMERFPDVRSVAEAPEEDLLKFWEGLGYYSRVLYIHQTAKILVDRHAGEFPGDYASIRALPGIGPYTAGALMSIAFNEDFPVVDGNVRRVFHRIFNHGNGDRAGGSETFYWKVAGELLPRGKARDFNQALMELGAVICLPSNPCCDRCPLRRCCESFRTGITHEKPKRPRKKTSTLEVSVGVLMHGEELFVQKRSGDGLMPNLWEFPGGKVEEGETPEDALVREFREELGLDVRCLAKVATIRHAYTSFRVTLHAYRCELRGKGQQPVRKVAVDARWVGLPELDAYAFPAANRKLLRILVGKFSSDSVSKRKDS